MELWPDWRNKAAYPSDIEAEPGTSSMLWAWQFLRRNPEYQDAYKASRVKGCGSKVRPSRFGLAFFLPPTMERPEYVPFTTTLTPIIHKPPRAAGEQHVLQVHLTRHQVAVVLDLDWSLNRQIDDLRVHLTKFSKTGDRRKRPEALSRYLRVIDALSQGATRRSIAAHFVSERTYSESAGGSFYVGQSVLESDIRRARELMARRYLELARS